jgi:hypothetical protein
MMEVNQEDQLECYFVVLACFLRTLQRRSRQRKLLLFVRAQDALAWKKYSGEKIFLRLVTPLLPKLESLPKAHGLDGTPAHLLVAYISNWVAGQITWWQNVGSENLRLLHDLLKHCIRLDKDCPEHRYRLGAVFCLMNEEQAARDIFAEAQECDGRLEFYNPERIEIMAAVHIELAYDNVSVSDGGAAAAVAFVMRAIKLGEKKACVRITERFTQTKYWDWQKTLGDYGVEPKWTTTDRVLCAALGLTLPEPPSQASTEAAA